MPAHLERQPRTVGTADVDLLTVGNVDRGHAAAVDVQAVEAAIVDSDPAALIEPQDEVGARDQRVRDADVGTEVAADHNVVAWREGARGAVVPNGQGGRVWSAHRQRLYPYRRRIRRLNVERVRTSA